MNLQTKRLEAGLSQKQLADKAGIKTGTIQQYESGYRNIDGAKIETLLDLAGALNCPIADILESEALIEKCKKVVTHK